MFSEVLPKVIAVFVVAVLPLGSFLYHGIYTNVENRKQSKY